MPKIGGELSRRVLIYSPFTEEKAREIAEAFGTAPLSWGLAGLALADRGL